MKRTTLAAITMLLLAGCNSSLKLVPTVAGSQSVASIDEAGSVHVAVLAITPWNDIKAKLRPELSIDAKDLRGQAMPVTFSMIDKYLDALRLQAALAPTALKTSTSSSLVTESGKDDVRKSTTTETSEPGTPRTVAPAASIPAAAAPGLAASGASGANSTLTARAMASFVQEINALNAEVDNAAQRTGFEPYLMRVQVSVMPRRRHLGYDVYANLSFFGYQGAYDPESGQVAARKANAGTPFIVPLLSTDAIEFAERSQSLEKMRDLGLAVDLLRGFGAANLSVGSLNDRQQALQGADVNSVQTMGRLADNTLRVRFGAANDPGGGYATHPRTNTISLLVFFPKNAQQSRIVSRSSWTHVVDGTVLDRSEERYDVRLQPLVAQWGHLGLDRDALKKLDELPLEGDYARFEKEMDDFLEAHCNVKWTPGSLPPKGCEIQGRSLQHELLAAGRQGEKERTYAYVWSHLLSLLPGSRFSTTLVDLPRQDVLCPPAAQLAVYADSDAGISVALGGGRNLGAAPLQAAVHWAYADKPKPAVAADQPATATATRTMLAVGRRTVTMVPVPAAAAAASAASAPASAPPPDGARMVLRSYAGAQLAQKIEPSADRHALALSFASANLQPVDWAGSGQLVPAAVELAGCKEASNDKTPRRPPGWTEPSRVFPDGSTLYALGAVLAKPEKADDKAKKAEPEVTLSSSTVNLVLNKDNSAATSVTVDLGDKPETAYALTLNGGTVRSALPADRIARRSDGAYLVKSSGPLDLSFINLVPNQPLDLQLRSVDAKGKLGTVARTLSFTVRLPKG